MEGCVVAAAQPNQSDGDNSLNVDEVCNYGAYSLKGTNTQKVLTTVRRRTSASFRRKSLLTDSFLYSVLALHSFDDSLLCGLWRRA